jgi:16S rRNA (guanine527-N7)-methyltransferase
MYPTSLLEQLGRSRDLGFLGDGPLEQHVELSSVLLGAAAAPLLGPGDEGQGVLTLVDLGSGGGIPGLVAAVDPLWRRVTLLDRSERRCAFLRSARVGLGADAVDVAVRCGSAETLGRTPELREQADVVVSRSFAAPSATLECAAAFVRVGGIVAVSDPPGGRAWPDGIDRLALELVHLSALSPALAVFRKTGVLADAYPRREGVPARRPLFEI